MDMCGGVQTASYVSFSARQHICAYGAFCLSLVQVLLNTYLGNWWPTALYL